MLYLLSLVMYLKGRSAAGAGREAGASTPLRLAWYAGAFVAGIAALATKEIAFTLPLALLLCELSFFDLTRGRKRAMLLGEAAVRLAPQVEKYRLNLATARQESGSR